MAAQGCFARLCRATCVLLTVALPCARAFMIPSGSPLSVHGAARVQLQPQHPPSSSQQQQHRRPHSFAPLTMAFNPEELADTRMWLNFAAFGFANRTCQLTLDADGDSLFGEGMVSKEPGAWRIEEEDGIEYLQFTCPLTELYAEIFDIPSALLFWRAELRRTAAGALEVANGVIISEKAGFMGFRTSFIREGTFRGRVLAPDEPFPAEGPVRAVRLAAGEEARGAGGKRRRKVPGAAGEGKGMAGGMSQAAPSEASEAQP